MRNIEAPQAFAYVGDLANKKIKGQNFKKGVPGVIWDPKVIRLCLKLPYMRSVSLPEAVAATVGRTKALQKQTSEPIVIPVDWRTLHYKKRMALARRVGGPHVEIATVAEADKVLEQHAPQPAAEPVAPQEEAPAAQEPVEA
jgi:hypothetical protein